MIIAIVGNVKVQHLFLSVTMKKYYYFNVLIKQGIL